MLGWRGGIDPGIPFTANLRVVYLCESSHVHAHRNAGLRVLPNNLTQMACQCRLLSWLGNEGHPERALEVFDWLERRKEYVTEDCHLYTRLVSMFARQKGGLATAMHIFDRMQARGIRPDTVAFNSAITAAGEPPVSASCPRTFHGLCIQAICT
jgi:pentatricopeptide repeat protein